MDNPKPGTIAWVDLTVGNADVVRDFYQAVAGWTADPVDMGGYSDYVMMAPTGDAAGGICWSRGTNEGIPPTWLVYIVVEDLDASLRHCTGLGGAVIFGPKGSGTNRMAVIRDPAGAMCALIQGAGV